MVNRLRNCVADELLFPAPSKFFDNMSEEDIMKCVNTCIKFVYNDLGYTKNKYFMQLFT